MHARDNAYEEECPILLGKKEASTDQLAIKSILKKVTSLSMAMIVSNLQLFFPTKAVFCKSC